MMRKGMEGRGKEAGKGRRRGKEAFRGRAFASYRSAPRGRTGAAHSEGALREENPLVVAPVVPAPLPEAPASARGAVERWGGVRPGRCVAGRTGVRRRRGAC